MYQGYLALLFPSTNCKYTMCKNKAVATTDTNDPILLIKFHPANASG